MLRCGGGGFWEGSLTGPCSDRRQSMIELAIVSCKLICQSTYAAFLLDFLGHLDGVVWCVARCSSSQDVGTKILCGSKSQATSVRRILAQSRDLASPFPSPVSQTPAESCSVSQLTERKEPELIPKLLLSSSWLLRFITLYENRTWTRSSTQDKTDILHKPSL